MKCPKSARDENIPQRRCKIIKISINNSGPITRYFQYREPVSYANFRLMIQFPALGTAGLTHDAGVKCMASQTLK